MSMCIVPQTLTHKYQKYTKQTVCFSPLKMIQFTDNSIIKMSSTYSPYSHARFFISSFITSRNIVYEEKGCLHDSIL